MSKAARPEELHGITYVRMTGCGKAYITINRCPKTDEIFEVFIKLGKAGGCAAGQTEVIGRLISLQARSGFSIGEEHVKELIGISCHQDGRSCGDALARVIAEEIDMELPKQKEEGE